MTAAKDLSPLFEPCGVVVAGASSHPGKFGFAALHNILSCGYQGNVYATNRSGGSLLGIDCLTSLSDVPTGTADVVYVCVPADGVPGVLREAAAVGIRGAFIASGGFGETTAGIDRERELTELAAELDMVIAGPNGQGLVSTPASLCAQFVGPFPPAGGVSVVSQSGNLASAAMNYATAGGVGIARAVSAGNAACLDVADYIDWFGDDPETKAVVAYIEGVADARRLFSVLQRVTATTPVVVVKGGTSAKGAVAAASHTGSLATDDRIFDGLLRQAGAVRARDMSAAFGAAAALAIHQPMRGPNVAVLTQAGGWGVLAADALEDSPLELMAIPADLFGELDAMMPTMWSRNNPIDVAGGETRDTIPEALAILGAHESVDAVLFLGLGIQSNTAKMMQQGPFADLESVERISSFHRRQDARYATAIVEVAQATNTPIVASTELSITDPQNPGPATLGELGHPCFESPRTAVDALSALYRVGQTRRATA